MSALKLTEQEFERIADDVVSRIVQEAALVMQQRINAAGFVVTSDLLKSIQSASLIQAQDLYAEFSIGFRGYGRFRDMKKLFFGKMPPIEALEDYVQHVGVDKFRYVPGYLLGVRYRVLHIQEKRAINRIAWGIAADMRGKARRMSGKKSFYNPVRGKLIYETSWKMLDALPSPIMQAIKERLEA